MDIQNIKYYQEFIDLFSQIKDMGIVMEILTYYFAVTAGLKAARFAAGFIAKMTKTTKDDKIINEKVDPILDKIDLVYNFLQSLDVKKPKK